MSEQKAINRFEASPDEIAILPEKEALKKRQQHDRELKQWLDQQKQKPSKSAERERDA
jgi:hypothetical protein